MECKPADSKAPEIMIERALDWLNYVFQLKFGESLLREHSETDNLKVQIHRFRGIDESGLRSLAKDLVKYSIERMDKRSLIDSLGLTNSNLGTLKLLQSLLSKYTDEQYAHDRMTPLFGAYDLRVADAHLSSSDVEECYSKLSVDRSAPFVHQAMQLIDSVQKAFGISGAELKRHAPDK